MREDARVQAEEKEGRAGPGLLEVWEGRKISADRKDARGEAGIKERRGIRARTGIYRRVSRASR